MSSELVQKLDAVCDEESFVAFVLALAADRDDEVAKEKSGQPSIYPWQNGTIEMFLECAAAWATASKRGLPLYQKPENPWKRCADILYAGKIYE
jgi:hypothetical protein